MAGLVQPNCVSSSSSSISISQRGTMVRGAISLPIRLPKNPLSLPSLPNRGSLVEELNLRNGYTHLQKQSNSGADHHHHSSMVLSKLYAIMEAVADRVEMHNNIGEQRNNWNSLLCTSINGITLTAATMLGIASASCSNVGGGAPLLALKLSSSLLYMAATGMLLVMNKIQPSQLAEEQRNASRLFRQLHNQIQTTISLGNATERDAKEAMERVLALDRAYPLPLLGAMIDKFPSKVEPAVWWPEPRRRRTVEVVRGEKDNNGWNVGVEEELRQIVGVLEKKDKEEYLRLGEKALKLNKVLAVSGPLLMGLAAIGSAFVGQGCWALVAGVVGGAMGAVVNTVEHGGQVGMVVEMYRGNAGFFRLMGESIEWNLREREVGRRENGELVEMKVALQLGRSLSELRSLAHHSMEELEFGSKLF